MSTDTEQARKSTVNPPDTTRVEVTPEMLMRLSKALDAIPVATWTVGKPERTHINGHPHTIWRVTSDENPGGNYGRYGVAVVLLPDEDDSPSDRKRCKAVANYIPMAQPSVVAALVERIRELETDTRWLLDVTHFNDGHLSGCAEMRGVGPCDCRLALVRKSVRHAPGFHPAPLHDSSGPPIGF